VSEWRQVRLSEVSSLIVDSEHKTAPKDPDGLHPLIRTTDLGKARADFRGAQRVSAAIHARWTARAIPSEGDLILAREAPVGGICRVPAEVSPVLGQRTVLVRPDPAAVDSGFLSYRLAAPDLQARLCEMSTGSTVPHLNMSDIRALTISDVPSLNTQRRIAMVLSAFDELIEINERRIELREDLARSLYREWFVRFRFPGHGEVEFVDSELGPIPHGWEVQRLGEIAQLSYGRSLPASKRHPGPFAVVGSAGIVGEHDKALVAGPGIVLGRKGNVGSVWWLNEDFFPIDTTYYVTSDQPPGFLYWQLSDLHFDNSHAAVPGLSRDHANSLLVICPDQATVRRFGEHHTRVFNAIAVLRAQSEALTATRDLLLPRLVTGRLDISDIDLGELLLSAAA